MELSEEVHSLLQRFKLLSKQSEESIKQDKVSLQTASDVLFLEDELINVDEIDMSDDETWLYAPSSSRENKVLDIKQWLYEGRKSLKDDIREINMSFAPDDEEVYSKKHFDSRTFTRPKKKINRPSIDKYNEDLFSTKYEAKDNNSHLDFIGNITSPLESMSEELLTNTTENLDATYIPLRKPLHFDLSQPTSLNLFDNILANAPDVESFQNMSPPSLVNSMSSSTFTNLMENSYIKNDPVLREIRDEEYSDELLQDLQAPMFQSFTESCSSMNSDTPENFLAKTLGPNFNNTFKKNMTSKDLSEQMKMNYTCTLNADLNETFDLITTNNLSATSKPCNDNLSNLNETYNKGSLSDLSSSDVDLNSSIGILNNHHILDDTMDIHSENIDPNSKINLINTTTIQNGTYRKKPNSKLNSTYNNIPNTEVHVDLNTTKIINEENNDINIINDRTITRKLSYTVNDFNATFAKDPSSKNELNETIILKNNHIGYPTGSSDSLDVISNVSNSSKGSNKMLNMAEVDAIIEKQELSLQIMSTPKPAKSLNKLWEEELSPIGLKDHNSESDLSSNDDYATVRSSLSKVSSLNSERDLILTEEKTAKSLGNLLNKHDSMNNPRSINTVTQGINSLKQNIKSQMNLKTVDDNLRGSLTNLRSMGSNLKGSYTNLKPYSSNLPHASSLSGSATNLKRSDPNLTRTFSNLERDETFKVPSKPNVRPPSSKSLSSNGQSTTSIKSQPRPSGLPRPVGSTGIPRPVSKIPGPKSTGSRPSSALRSNMRVPSNKDLKY